MTNGKPNCTLNGVPVSVHPKATITVGVQAYRDKEQLDGLRGVYRGKYFFKRDKSSLLSIPLESGLASLGDEVAERTLADNPWLIAPLMGEALLRYFHRVGRPILRHRPLHILADRPEDRLLRAVLPGDVVFPPWLEQRVGYLFETRVLRGDSGPPHVILACDAKSYTTISAPCTKLLSLDIPIVGLYVQTHESKGDERLVPKAPLAGRVIEVQGDYLLLDDTGGGPGRILAEQAFLEPRQENLARCVRSIEPDRANAILDGLARQIQALSNGPGRLKRIGAMFVHLSKVGLEVAPGVPVSLGGLLRETTKSSWFPGTELMSRPHLWFDPGGRRSDEWNERGLDKHGPYDHQVFSPKELKIAVVCQAEVKGQVEAFVRRFLDGMPSARAGQREPFGKGFIRRFMLEPPKLRFFTTDGSGAADYRKACAEAIAFSAEKGFKWNLGLIQIRDAFHQLKGPDDPYLVAKSLFMKRQVPVQEVTLEKMEVAPSELAFIMSDISLATYAKVGGTPWLLPSGNAVTHELVIGLGSSEFAASRLGSRERNVGITTIFSGDGRYILEGRTAAVPFADYSRALLVTLEGALSKVREEQNWASKDAVRLIFHVFKPLRDAEVEAVVALVKGLSLPNTEFAFVHVADDHPFLVFNEAEKGLGPPSARKGEMAPPRGLFMRFTRDECLISLTGPREIKVAGHGLPRPLLLKLHRESTFRDMTYLARQAHAFSCQSWRGFGLASLPITILYSQLIARLLRKLQDLPDWDPDAMLDQIGRTRWFL